MVAAKTTRSAGRAERRRRWCGMIRPARRLWMRLTTRSRRRHDWCRRDRGRLHSWRRRWRHRGWGLRGTSPVQVVDDPKRARMGDVQLEIRRAIRVVELGNELPAWFEEVILERDIAFQLELRVRCPRIGDPVHHAPAPGG